MKNIVLRFRVIDRSIFNDIITGQKTVETRAASMKYRHIQRGDSMTLICGKDKVVRKIGKAEYYKNIDTMLKQIDYKKILPRADSLEEVRLSYDSFPGYREKLKLYGIMAFYI